MTKVSVIIPVYNTENYLRKCLDSVVAQTMQDIEVICINDGSTDGSLDILKEYAAKDSRFVIVDKKNEGVSAARNLGIEKASSEYIMFLDSDDYYAPEACQMAYDAITSAGADVGLFGHYLVKGRRIKEAQIAENNNYMDFINVWNKIFKTSFLRENSIFFPLGIKTGEDIIFAYTVYFSNPKLVFINKHLMYYRDARKDSSTTKDINELESDIEAFEYFVGTEIFKNQNIENKLKVVDKFSSILGWLATKAKTKSDILVCEILLNRYLRLLETFELNKELQNMESYNKCKNVLNTFHKKTSILDNIFSIKSTADMRHSIIKCFGIKLKVAQNIQKRYQELSRLYQNNISRIKKEALNRKIRVAFYVNDGRWKCQNLFDLMQKSEHYSPFIVIGSHEHGTQKFENQTEKELTKLYDLYKSKNMEVYLASHDETGDNPLLSFKPDIVFYSRPWGIPEAHNIFSIAERALTCYVPYFISNSPAEVEAGSAFQNFLWRYYVLNQDLIEEYSPVMKNCGDNLKVSGYPFLDQYSKPFKEDSKYIIYAPHWTVGGKFLNYSTFEWNGEYILDFAKKHPELNWVFKPHPILKGTLVETGIWTQEKADKYYEEWDKIGIKYEGADYLDLFRQSKAMITDCGSFLAEYMPTKNPVILLRSEKATPYNFLAQKVTKYYYKAHNLNELETLLDEVVIRGEDKDRDKRLAMLDELQLITNASQNIIDDLNETFGIKLEDKDA